jgi:hypothetical protein
MHAGHGAVGNTVTVDVQVTMEFLHLLQLFAAVHLAAVGHVVVVPFQIGAHPVVHADIEIAQHHDRRLQALGQIKGIAREVETLLRIARKQAHVFGVAM